MNIRLDEGSVRVRVTHDEALRLNREGVLKDRWLEVRTNSPAGLFFESKPTGFLFCLAQRELGQMFETGELELEQSGELELRFEIDRFTL